MPEIKACHEKDMYTVVWFLNDGFLLHEKVGTVSGERRHVSEIKKCPIAILIARQNTAQFVTVAERKVLTYQPFS